MKKKFLFLSSPNLMPFKKSQFISSWFLLLFLTINQSMWTSEAMGRAVDNSVIDDVDSHIGLTAFMTKLTNLAISHCYIVIKKKKKKRVLLFFSNNSVKMFCVCLLEILIKIINDRSLQRPRNFQDKHHQQVSKKKLADFKVKITRQFHPHHY